MLTIDETRMVYYYGVPLGTGLRPVQETAAAPLYIENDRVEFKIQHDGRTASVRVNVWLDVYIRQPNFSLLKYALRNTKNDHI